MEHEDDIEQRPAPETPQSVWQSLDPQEEPGMEMSLTADQLCARARYREKENIWFPWIVGVGCLGFAAACAYCAIRMEQVWMRLGAAWMALLTIFAFWGTVRVGARRMQAGESCAHFMVRELEGSRRTVLAARRGIILILPALSMWWWGAWRTLQASSLRLLHPSVWRHTLLTLLETIVAVLLVLLAMWVGMGVEAGKRARQAKELRHAIGMPE